MTLNGLGECLTIGGLIGLLWAEANQRPTARAITKPVASAGFIVAAIGFGALDSVYGRIVFVGLVCGAVGDVCLLGQNKPAFVSGLVAFLIGHVAYAFAFGGLPQDETYALITAIVMLMVGVAVARWVFPHTPTLKMPIAAYIIAIAAMVILAVGAYGLGAPWMIPLGAIMFAVSDITVVRHRFVSPAFVNRATGLPLYYGAQLLIAWSIQAVANAGL